MSDDPTTEVPTKLLEDLIKLARIGVDELEAAAHTGEHIHPDVLVAGHQTLLSAQKLL